MLHNFFQYILYKIISFHCLNHEFDKFTYINLCCFFFTVFLNDIFFSFYIDYLGLLKSHDYHGFFNVSLFKYFLKSISSKYVHIAYIKF
jgi:hypothetical protein